MSKIIIIAKLTDKKLSDKILPLKEALPSSHFYILRRFRGEYIKNVNFVNAPNFLSKKPILGTLFIMLKGLFLIPKINPNFIISYYFVPHGIISLILGKLFRKKVICSIIGTDQLKLQNKLLSKVYIELLKKADLVVVTGSKLRDNLINKSINRNKIKMLPNTKKITIFKDDFSQKSIDFLYVGRLITIKQIDVLIKAFNNIKSIKENLNFYIIGEGSERANLVRLIKKLDLEQSVFLVGYKKNVNKYYERAKFIVLSSKIEGLPAVLVEGMMNGCIPISSNVGDIKDIISNDAGFLVDPEEDNKEKLIMDFSEIFKKTLKLDLKTLEKISNKNKKNAEKYDYSYGGKLWSLYLLNLFKEN